MDTLREARTKQESAARAAAVRAALQEEDAVRDLAASRLRVKAHYAMEVPAAEVVGLLDADTLYVANLPLPKPSAKEARLLDCAKRLRLVERLEMRHVVVAECEAARAAASASLERARGTSATKHTAAAAAAGNAAYRSVLAALDRGDGAWPGVRAEVPEGVDWVINEGLLAPEADVVGRILASEAPKDPKKKKGAGGNEDEDKKKDGGGVAAAAHDDDSDDEDAAAKAAAAAAMEAVPELPPLAQDDIKTFLYPPTALRTSGQRRLQVLFLQELARALRKGFNVHLDKLASAKQDEVEKIEERNARIKEIAKLLALAGEESGAFEVVRAPSEFPEACLDVDEEEMSQGPYVDPPS